ncbi:MAG: type II toxin-antitoxin system VapC family toxin [Acidimicrobiales bacterium]
MTSWGPFGERDLPVIDASVLVDALVNGGPSGAAARAELGRQSALVVPDIFKAEVASALRGLLQRGELSPTRARLAIERLRSAAVNPYPFEPFLDRVWELRENLTTYDAWYVALAEALGTELVTADARLAAAPGPRCVVRLPPPVPT